MVSFKGREDDVTWTYGFSSAICWRTASALKKRMKKKWLLVFFDSIYSILDTFTSEEYECHKISTEI